MAKAQTLKRNNLTNPTVLVLLVFLLGFAGFGVYKLAFSDAASLSTTLYARNDASRWAPDDLNINVSVVDDTLAQVGGYYGPVKVLQVGANGQLNFGGKGAVIDGAPAFVGGRTCYVLRTLDGPAQVRLAHNGKNNNVFTKVVSLKAAPAGDGSNYWQHICVNGEDKLERKGPIAPVYNQSTSRVNVLEVQHLNNYGYQPLLSIKVKT